MWSTMMRRMLAVAVGAGLVFGGMAWAPAAQAQTDKAPPCQQQEHCGDRALRALLFHETVIQTGLEPRQVERQLRTGKSLSEIAARHGSSEQAVIAAALRKLSQRLDQAVANGRITAEQKAQIMAAAGRRAPVIMNHKQQPPN